MILFRRAVQVISLFLFLGFLFSTILWGYKGFGADLFLRMDPALMGISTLSGRVVLASLWPCLIVLLSALFFGRFFCGYICPMGTTLDGAQVFLGPKKNYKSKGSGPIRLKYLVLTGLIMAGVCGVGLVFWGSPLSLITRFYGLLIHPVFMLTAQTALSLIKPLAEQADITWLVMAQIKTPRFATQIFILFFFGAIFGLAWFAPRAFCRYLCPAGAILGIFSLKPLIKRHVSNECTECGLCVQKCPMGAISFENPKITRNSECLICFTCEAICPENAINFGVGQQKAFSENSSLKDFKNQPDLRFFSRRAFIKAGAAGLGVAAVGLSGLESPLNTKALATFKPAGLLRPPGALPEPDFLARCVRCGECMAVCPRNALQPIWLDSGWLGLFSPALVPKRGFCDPHCNLCGQVCPTGAIRDLILTERRWARPGIANINRRTCLAWEHQKTCMVCDEVCPFKAIRFEVPKGGKIAVPHVLEDRCSGCGSCEHYCPIRGKSAITVSPMGALRLKQGSFVEYGKAKGLNISLKTKEPVIEQDHSAAPGFTQ